MINEYASYKVFNRLLGKIRQSCPQGLMSELEALRYVLIFVKHRSHRLDKASSTKLALFMFRLAIGALLTTGLNKEQIAELLKVTDKDIEVKTRIQNGLI